MYYFAYGSNMDEKDLQEWCETRKPERSFPKWKFHGTACLENYLLAFNYYSTGRKGGAANLMEAKNNKVYGLLFEMNNDYDLDTIRCKEGYPTYYKEIRVTVRCKDISINNVITYKVANNKEIPDHQRPTKYYMDLILNNASKNGFPEDYIKYLKKIETQ